MFGFVKNRIQIFKLIICQPYFYNMTGIKITAITFLICLNDFCRFTVMQHCFSVFNFLK